MVVVAAMVVVAVAVVATVVVVAAVVQDVRRSQQQDVEALEDVRRSRQLGKPQPAEEAAASSHRGTR